MRIVIIVTLVASVVSLQVAATETAVVSGIAHTECQDVSKPVPDLQLYLVRPLRGDKKYTDHTNSWGTYQIVRPNAVTDTHYVLFEGNNVFEENYVAVSLRAGDMHKEAPRICVVDRNSTTDQLTRIVNIVGVNALIALNDGAPIDWRRIVQEPLIGLAQTLPSDRRTPAALDALLFDVAEGVRAFAEELELSVPFDLTEDAIRGYAPMIRESWSRGIGPGFFEREDWEKVHGPIGVLTDAPTLISKVAGGELPPLEHRIPTHPLVIEPVDEIGQYGGTIRQLRPRGSDFHLGRTVREPPFAYAPHTKSFHPNVLRGLEFSADGKVATMHLRKGMRWSDGGAFLANDFLFFWNDIALNEDLYPIVPSFVLAGGEEGRMEKVSDTAVRISWDAPSFGIREALVRWGRPNYAPSEFLKQYHPSYVERATLESLALANGFESWHDQFWGFWNLEHSESLPGVGPWYVESFQGNDVLKLDRNPYYWKIDTAGNQLPYIDSVEITAVRPDLELLSRVLGGDIDVVFDPTSGDAVSGYEIEDLVSDSRFRIVPYGYVGIYAPKGPSDNAPYNAVSGPLWGPDFGILRELTLGDSNAASYGVVNVDIGNIPLSISDATALQVSSQLYIGSR